MLCFQRSSAHPSRISRKFVSKFEIFALYFAGGFVMGAMRLTDPGAQGGGKDRARPQTIAAEKQFSRAATNT
jgi:hypothetical protein